MNISYVPYGNVASLIPALLPLFKKSAERSDGRICEDDLLRLILTDLMQLWVVHEGEKIQGFFGLEVKQYPRCKMLVIQYCAMETGTLQKVQDQMMTIASDLAGKSGCAGVEFIGRPGWKNTADKNGYSVQSIMYQKFF